jgi:hypothetical protein
MRTIKQLAIAVLTASCLAGSAQAQFVNGPYGMQTSPGPLSPPIFQPPPPPPPPPRIDYQGYGQYTVRTYPWEPPVSTFCLGGRPC